MADKNTVKTESGIEVYEDKISEYLDQYIADHDIEDMHREPQSRWNAALIYINKNLFKVKSCYEKRLIIAFYLYNFIYIKYFSQFVKLLYSLFKKSLS